jgi:hypothetical protein
MTGCFLVSIIYTINKNGIPNTHTIVLTIGAISLLLIAIIDKWREGPIFIITSLAIMILYAISGIYFGKDIFLSIFLLASVAVIISVYIKSDAIRLDEM